MRFALSILAPAIVAAALFAAPASEARAGDVSNAQLACYVDTYAWDTPEVGQCFGAWTPYTAENPSVAVFEIQGLAPGNYTFYWTDTATGQTGICGTSMSYCVRTIYVNQSKQLSVTIVDQQTGASKTVGAYAYYFDGWN